MSVENPYDTIAPSSRVFSGGDFPVKNFKAQNGADLRILYGNKLTKKTLKLSYQNCQDATAQKFLEHYFDRQGSYKSFRLEIKGKIFDGYTADARYFNRDKLPLDDAANRSYWYYAKPPTITQTFTGRSTVTVELVSALKS